MICSWISDVSDMECLPIYLDVTDSARLASGWSRLCQIIILVVVSQICPWGVHNLFGLKAFVRYILFCSSGSQISPDLPLNLGL